MKKILVNIYLANNLGDDLFLDTLVKKYPTCQFTLNYTSDNYDKFIANYPNVNRLFALTDHSKLAVKYDALIYIGGSLFQEVPYSEKIYTNRMNLVNEFAKINKPIFILGSNFGSYINQNFYDKYNIFFNKCSDVCFRDKYSYNLFKHLPQVRYAPDIAFQSLLYNEAKGKLDNKRIGFSIINFKNRPKLSKYDSNYIDSLCKSIKLFIDKGYTCHLISFCTPEGDLEAIKYIKSKLDNKLLKSVFFYEYKSNLKDYINLISTFSLFITCRFHANIIALSLKVPILPIIYDIKSENMLKDLNLENLIFNINDLSYLYDKDIINKSFNNILLSLDSLISESKHQFDKLTDFINK